MAHRQFERPWGIWLVVCAVLLGTAGVGCSIGDRPASTWDELGQVASTYPLPPEFVLVATEQKGELCRRPSCENPRVALRLSPTESLTHDELCDALYRSLQGWEGFALDERQPEDQTTCSFNGTIDGKKVGAFAASESELAQGYTPVIVSVWP